MSRWFDEESDITHLSNDPDAYSALQLVILMWRLTKCSTLISMICCWVTRPTMMTWESNQLEALLRENLLLIWLPNPRTLNQLARPVRRIQLVISLKKSSASLTEPRFQWLPSILLPRWGCHQNWRRDRLTQYLSIMLSKQQGASPCRLMCLPGPLMRVGRTFWVTQWEILPNFSKKREILKF